MWRNHDFYIVIFSLSLILSISSCLKKSVNKTWNKSYSNLIGLVAIASNLLENSPIGDDPGEYPPIASVRLKQSLESAQTVLQKDSSISQIDSATTTLSAEIDYFRSAVIFDDSSGADTGFDQDEGKNIDSSVDVEEDLSSHDQEFRNKLILEIKAILLIESTRDPQPEPGNRPGQYPPDTYQTYIQAIEKDPIDLENNSLTVNDLLIIKETLMLAIANLNRSLIGPVDKEELAQALIESMDVFAEAKFHFSLQGSSNFYSQYLAQTTIAQEILDSRIAHAEEVSQALQGISSLTISGKIKSQLGNCLGFGETPGIGNIATLVSCQTAPIFLMTADGKLRFHLSKSLCLEYNATRNQVQLQVCGSDYFFEQKWAHRADFKIQNLGNFNFLGFKSRVKVDHPQQDFFHQWIWQEVTER